MLIRRLTTALALVVMLNLSLATVPAQTRKARPAAIQTEDLQQWLTYLASDELEGRATFSEGLGLAAAYIAEQLRAWGVKPGGDNGSYFQRVKVLGVKSTNNSTLTVEVNGQSRIFKDGAGIVFPKNVGGKRTVTVDQVEFVGYGLDAPLANYNDYAGKELKGKAVVYLGGTVPQGLDQQLYTRLLSSRSRYATEQQHAVAAIGPVSGRGSSGRAGEGASNPQMERPDFTTAQRLDRSIAPAVSAQDELFEFLFSQAPNQYAELKEKAAKREPLPAFALKGVKLTFKLDADYEIVRTQYTRNVVGIVEGTDPKLKNTYVAFGAHYDHVGYSEGRLVETPAGPRFQGGVGRVTKTATEDRIWNGADDDGSGTVAIMGVAKAFAQGPKPKRSLLFIWHAGEERGLLGSRYFADFSAIPMDNIVAQVNLDMVGRNRNNSAEEANTVYVIGSDRISTELHNLNVDANAKLAKPLHLNYDFNDPTDLEQLYFRSDHYSYAAKGIPVIFLTTLLHPDYHANTDSIEKINFEKMTRIAQLSYETGRLVANLAQPPTRDNKGPRAGKGTVGKLAE